MAETLVGTDVSSWQPANIGDLVDYDFLIAKATGGVSYVSKHCDQQIQSAIRRGKKFGFYHFANDDNLNSSPVAEADFFINNTQGYFGHGIPVLDFEAQALQFGAEYVRAFCQRVIDKTGIHPWVYCSTGQRPAGFDKVLADLDCGFWAAAYPNSNPQGYSRPAPPCSNAVAYQYASTGRLDGYAGDLDINVFYGSAQAWDAYSGKVNAGTATPVPPSTDSGSSHTPDVPAKATNAQIAAEVWEGKWGAGDDRKARLAASGYSYDDVMALVNADPRAKSTGNVYTVKSGDTLSKIAAANNTTWKELQRINGIQDANRIYPGQVIRLR